MRKPPFTAMVDTLERAARNGNRAHLEVEQVRALVSSDVFAALTEEKRRELVETWQTEAEAPPKAEPSSDHSGSGIGPTATTGASAGTMTAQEQEAVERAESRRASEAVGQTKRHKRRKTH